MIGSNLHVARSAMHGFINTAWSAAGRTYVVARGTGNCCPRHRKLLPEAQEVVARGTGRTCCCPRHSISLSPLCEKGMAPPVFQRRLKHFHHLSPKKQAIFHIRPSTVYFCSISPASGLFKFYKVPIWCSRFS